MQFREATVEDIAQMQRVRNAVKENVLSDPSLVTEAHYREYIANRGKGWVCEAEGKVVGFAIADLADNNIWALFIDPAYEGKGIGRQLHDRMLQWYFTQTSKPVWLSTAPASRAESFYRKAGWIETGIHGKGEIRFEMTAEQWKKMRLTA